MRHSFFVVMIGLAVSSGAQAQSETRAQAACALQEPDAPRPRGLGTIIRIQDAAVARVDIPMREARRGGAIDPRFLNDRRAVVQRGDGNVDTFDVSPEMTANVGDRVSLQGSYRSMTSTCSYIPQMVVPIDVPIA
jgi:hypothetical protein